MSTLSKTFLSNLRGRMQRLRATDDQGLQTAEWVFLIVGALVIAGIVIAAITAFVNSQIAQLPGT